jgi:predicted ATPase
MTYLRLNNFKCFIDGKIPLKTLTVLAGANGNGKSTMIQALLFLRKTIEENCTIFEDHYVSEGVKGNSNVSLNSGYMLSFGNSSYLVNRLASTEEIRIGISGIQDRFEAQYCTDLGESQLHVRVNNLTSYFAEEIPILKKEFYYLNAERIGPRANQGVQYSSFRNAGFQGEYVAQLISETNYSYEVEEKRRHSETKSPRLEQQVNAWLEDLMPGVNITARFNVETMTAQIQVENHFTKGDPTTAPNIGFGISYVLPIIATGLIAEKGSYMVVENPEAHLHPSAQSKIGRFLAMIAKNGVNVILETHSDHVINGIQIAAAKGEVQNDDVVVNFFSQGDGEIQPRVQSIDISAKGELSEWPRGFFDQTQVDFAELFKLRKG